MDYLVMLRLRSAPRDALQCGCVPGRIHIPHRPWTGESSPGSNPETRMTKLTQRLFLVAVLNPNLGGCRQRAPYPLRPTRQERAGEDRRGRRALIWLRLFFGLIAAALFLAIFGPARRLAQISGWRLGRTLTVAFHRLLCFTIDARLRLHGAPSLAPRRLIVSNHVSWLDIPLLGAIEPMTFLAKKEVGGAFLGRQAALLQGIVFVDRQRKRGLPEVNANMARAMRAREPVLLFAEATTGDGNRLLRFRSSHFEAIRQARATAPPDLATRSCSRYSCIIPGSPACRSPESIARSSPGTAT